MEDRELLFKENVTHEELQKEYEPRLRLLEIALNRHFPEDAEWQCSFDKNGDVEVKNSKQQHFHIPQYQFYYKPKAIEVFKWFVEHAVLGKHFCKGGS